MKTNLPGKTSSIFPNFKVSSCGFNLSSRGSCNFGECGLVKKNLPVNPGEKSIQRLSSQAGTLMKNFTWSTHQGIGAITFLKENWFSNVFCFASNVMLKTKKRMQVMEAKIQLRQMGLEYSLTCVIFFLVNQLVNVYLPTVAWFGNLIGWGLPTSLGSKSTQNGDRNEKLENLGPEASQVMKDHPKKHHPKIFSHGLLVGNSFQIWQFLRIEMWTKIQGSFSRRIRN